MKLYTTLATTNYEWINIIDNSDYVVFRCLDGRAVSKEWVPIKIKTVQADKKTEKVKI